MPQVPYNKEYRTFARGLITEASPLNFPENASLEEDNYELNIKQYRSRRLGIDFENSFSLIDSESLRDTFEASAINVIKWEDVNEDGNLDILVVQIGLRLFFFDANASSVSSAPLNGGLSIVLQGDSTYEFKGTVISGNLVLATNTSSVYQLIYDEANDQVSYIQHGLLVRDIWGINDRLPDGYRMSLVDHLSFQDRFDHRLYNLYNQGWGKLSPERDADTDITYAVEYRTDIDRQVYPNNYEKVIVGIDSSNDNRFNGEFVIRDITGNTPAPKGSFIIDLFNRGESRFFAINDYTPLDNYASQQQTPITSQLSSNRWEETDANGNKVYGAFEEIKDNTILRYKGLPSNFSDGAFPLDRTVGGCRVVSSFAGRVAYSGFSSETIDGDSRSPNLGAYVLISQVVTSEDKVGKCYQEGDPTSSDEIDLVDTDGVSIVIPGAGTILELKEFGRSLVVIANNGIWEIRGGEDGFSASSFLVEKITEVGCISAPSVVVAENNIFYWAVNGIYRISREEVGLNLIAQNITENTIRSFYNELSPVTKRYAKGVYGESVKKIEWVFNDTANYTDGLAVNKYNRQLTFDLSLQAFYTYTFALDETDTTYPYIGSIYNSPNFLALTDNDPVVIGEDPIVIGPDPVVVSTRIISSNDTRTGYLAVIPQDPGAFRITFASLSDTTFVDWSSQVAEPLDAAGRLVTGFELVDNDTQRDKQANYVTVHLERTETGFDIDLNPTNESSCLMSATWDFANHPNSGKIGDKYQVYRLNRRYVPSGSADSFDYGQSVITTKNRIRGRGKALTLTFETEPGKNCIIYGWGSTLLVNQDV